VQISDEEFTKAELHGLDTIFEKDGKKSEKDQWEDNAQMDIEDANDVDRKLGILDNTENKGGNLSEKERNSENLTLNSTGLHEFVTLNFF